MVPSDGVFPQLKNSVKSSNFSSNSSFEEKAVEILKALFAEQDKNFISKGVEALQVRCSKCIQLRAEQRPQFLSFCVIHDAQKKNLHDFEVQIRGFPQKKNYLFVDSTHTLPLALFFHTNSGQVRNLPAPSNTRRRSNACGYRLATKTTPNVQTHKTDRLAYRAGLLARRRCGCQSFTRNNRFFFVYTFQAFRLLSRT